MKRTPYQDTELPTGKTSGTLATYQPVVAAFDEMTPARRLAFVELARAFVALGEEDAALLVDLGVRLARG